MGKSNKKVKNDRINAIRKQYDAYLEEDKKRRERNEYILGKLDKMRSSTALVPVSSKVNYRRGFNPSEILTRSNNVITKMRDNCMQNVSTDILNKPLDELRILKEISKNYILIPKRRTPFENDYIYNKDLTDEDWKSKYNILDDLKKLEKESPSDLVFKEYKDDNSDKTSPNLQNVPNDIDNVVSDKELIIQKIVDKSTVEQDKVSKEVNFIVPKIISQDIEEGEIILQSASLHSEEAITIDQTLCVDNDAQEHIINPQEENITIKEKYNSESNEKDFDTNKHFNNDQQACDTGNINYPTIYQESVNSSDFNILTTETNKFTAEENITVDMSSTAISDQTISDVNPQETATVQYSEEIVHSSGNIDNKNDTSEIREVTSNEGIELYDDIDNNPDGQIVPNETNFDQPQQYDPVQNTIPIEPENIQQLEHAEHESEINAFEAEQKEMFYSEQPHAETYTYNEGEGNAGEYTDGYEQNDQYAYYEGVQQEEAYATNINEHEESTERYDPHYNQQYEGSYENQQPDNNVSYESTNPYEQQSFQEQNQQFENIANYENQEESAHLYQQENINKENEVQQDVLAPQNDQMYDQHLYAEGTPEEIEQQLITEEGYIESPGVIPDEVQKQNEGEVEKVIDTPTQEEILPDPKLA